MKSRNLKLLVCLSLLLSISQAYSFDSGSTGSDGALAPVANTNVVLPANGILNYTTLNIPAGITVTFVPNNANTPAYILVQGDAVIDGDIDVSGLDANEIGTPPPGGFAGGQPLISRGGTGFGPGGSQGGISNSGGTGGSYAQFGFQGGNQSSASRGAIYGSTTLQPLLGGSGGGATVIQTSVDPAKGGSGGGAILLAVSGTLTLNGSIQAQGGDGGINTSNILGSGGGSGGAVRVIATELVGAGTVNINGGTGGKPTGNGADLGGDGGFGRARLEAEIFDFSGSVSPNIAVTSAPQPIFAANLPTVVITTVGGATVPANPTGENDVVLSSSISNPVTVEFAATDVPLGSIIELTITPDNGGASTVTSSALTGTVENSTASAQVSLSQGASTLVASVSFNVTSGLSSLYAPYTNGELVAKVELRNQLGLGSEMWITTESGNIYKIKT